jgi:Uma2 family endonuclease
MVPADRAPADDAERSPEADWLSEVVCPPGDLDSCELPLESDLHLFQILLLLQCLQWAWRDRQDFYAAGNLTIYYSPRQRKSEYFRGPDFFAVLGVDPHPRKSWVVWEEGGQYPHIIIELLSDSTAQVDRTEKKQIYQDVFRTPDYFWFDPQTGEEFAGFHLLDGRYEPIAPNDQGLLWSEQLGLYLGRHEGKLRFFDADGCLLPTPQEDAIRAQEDASQAREDAIRAQETNQRLADQLAAEQQKRQQLAAKLRELGLDPDQLTD